MVLRNRVRVSMIRTPRGRVNPVPATGIPVRTAIAGVAAEFIRREI